MSALPRSSDHRPPSPIRPSGARASEHPTLYLAFPHTPSGIHSALGFTAAAVTVPTKSDGASDRAIRRNTLRLILPDSLMVWVVIA